MQWLRARDHANRVLALPNQTENLIEQYGLTRAEVDRTAWAIDSAGRRYAGAAAVNRVWRELGGFWNLLSALYELPIFKELEDWGYEWIAKNRWRF